MTAKSFDQVFEELTRQCLDMDAPLAERLAVVTQKVRELSPEFTGVVERMVARLRDNGVGLGAPGVGDVMPEFILPDQEGKLVHLSQLTAQGPVVISINRGHWCPYCQINADALSTALPAIRELGASLVVITPELPN